MDEAVSRRPVIAETRVRSRVSPCDVSGGQTGTDTGFAPFSPVTVIPSTLRSQLLDCYQRCVILQTNKLTSTPDRYTVSTSTPGIPECKYLQWCTYPLCRI